MLAGIDFTAYPPAPPSALSSLNLNFAYPPPFTHRLTVGCFQLWTIIAFRNGKEVEERCLTVRIQNKTKHESLCMIGPGSSLWLGAETEAPFSTLLHLQSHLMGRVVDVRCHVSADMHFCWAFLGGETTCFMPIKKKKKADVVGELASGEHRQNRKRWRVLGTSVK